MDTGGQWQDSAAGRMSRTHCPGLQGVTAAAGNSPCGDACLFIEAHSPGWPGRGAAQQIDVLWLTGSARSSPDPSPPGTLRRGEVRLHLL